MVKLGHDLYMQARAGITEIHFLPFNPTEKRTALTYVDNTGKWYRASKGAPEQVHFHFRTICFYRLGKFGQVLLCSTQVFHQIHVKVTFIVIWLWWTTILIISDSSSRSKQRRNIWTSTFTNWEVCRKRAAITWCCNAGENNFEWPDSTLLKI